MNQGDLRGEGIGPSSEELMNLGGYMLIVGDNYYALKERQARPMQQLANDGRPSIQGLIMMQIVDNLQTEDCEFNLVREREVCCLCEICAGCGGSDKVLLFEVVDDDGSLFEPL